MLRTFCVHGMLASIDDAPTKYQTSRPMYVMKMIPLPLHINRIAIFHVNGYVIEKKKWYLSGNRDGAELNVDVQNHIVCMNNTNTQTSTVNSHNIVMFCFHIVRVQQFYLHR